MKKYLLILVTIFIIVNCFSQTPNWAWGTISGDAAGDLGYDNSECVTTDVNGNVYITGSFENSITFGSHTLISGGGSNLFIVKYDSNGNVLWAKSATGNGSDGAYGITIDINGNVYVVGSFMSQTLNFGNGFTLTNLQFTDIFIAKYDTNGNIIWVKREGTFNDEWAKCVTTDTSGNLYVTGFFYGTLITFGSTTLFNSGTNGNGPADIFIVKYDANGNVIWAKSAGGNDYDECNAISLDRNGNLYIAGDFGSTRIRFGTDTCYNSNDSIGDSTYNIFLAKYDSNGNVIWAQSIKGSKNGYANGVKADAAGNVYLTGYFESDSIAFRTNELLSQGFPWNMFLAKLDSSGNAIWLRSGYGDNAVFAYGLDIDNNGNAYVAGNIDGTTITLDTITLTNINHNGYIAKYDNNGNINWVKAVYWIGPSSLILDNNKNIYTTGECGTTFSLDNIIVTNPNGGTADVFLAKLQQCFFAQPVVSSNNSTVLCQGHSLILSSNYIHDNLWSTGDTTQSITINSAGNYSVRYTNATGCSDLSSLTSVSVIPNAALTGAYSFCQGDSTILTSSNANSYLWNTGDTTQSIVVNSSGIFSVSVINNGCYSTSVNIYVTENQLPVIRANTTEPIICDSQQTICYGAGTATSYSWTGGITNGVSFAPSTTSSYTVTGIDNNGCSNTSSVTVTVNPLPIVTVNSPTICAGQTASLTGNGATSYTWSVGADSTGVNTANATPMVTTTYTVTGTSLGCTGTAISTVTVDCTVGVNESSDKTNITISPNPFTSLTTISFSSEQTNTTIKIADVLGKEIKALNFSGKELIIMKGTMQAGIYFVQITSFDKLRMTQVVENRKVVVQ